jgi:putative drug exporter of the RND superfamily
MARHRGVVLITWAVLLGVCILLYPSLEKSLNEPNYKIEGSQSSRAESLLSGAGFRGAGDEQDAIVFRSHEHRATDPVYRAVVARVLGAARSQAGVEGVVGPYGAHGAPSSISPDGHAALAHLALSGNLRERFKRADDIQSAVARAGGRGVRAWLTGSSALSVDISHTESADAGRSEMIGVPLAFVVLVLALGAITAAIIPLLLAGSGVLLTFGVIALLAHAFDFDNFLVTIVTLIGVGIGIDYSLFVVSRFREELAREPANPRRERRRVARAVGAALATSGRTILYSGMTVALSLTSLLVIRAPLFREFVLGVGAAVACTLVAALTLLPAVLAQLGERIDAGALPRRARSVADRSGTDRSVADGSVADRSVADGSVADGSGVPGGEGGWARWALVMTRRPALVSAGVLLLLLVALLPALGLRSGVAIDLPAISQTPSGEGAQVLARSFGAGLTAPIEVVVSDRAGGALPAAATLAAELRRDRRVAEVVERGYPAGALLTVVPSVPVDSTPAGALVRHIRADLAPPVGARDGVDVLVGGWPAQSVDASALTMGSLPLVVGITLAIALLFLLVVFRSVVLPLKAVAMNLLATGAALGLVVFVFQDGHGQGLLDFSSSGFILTYLPLFMFVLLFGLSMDYEIFLIRRMQEAWRDTADNRRAVAVGLERTARPISAAAAIMVVVFGSSATARILELKEVGFALALAIAIDATLVRLVLVPALMCLLDSRNWWLPERLERVLPRLGGE